CSFSVTSVLLSQLVLLILFLSFFYMLPRPPSSTLFPTRRSSDLHRLARDAPDRTGGRRPRGHRVVPREAAAGVPGPGEQRRDALDRKSTRLNSSHDQISYAVFCLKKKKKKNTNDRHSLRLSSLAPGLHSSPPLPSDPSPPTPHQRTPNCAYYITNLRHVQ